jgi:hypothetical protein
MLYLLPAAVSLAAMSCGGSSSTSDGFQPAPPDAGNVWNGQNPPAAVGVGGPASGGGQSALCSDDLKNQRQAWMLSQPITPPRLFAGIDLAKDDQWDGLRIEDAEAVPASASAAGGGLCQSSRLGSEGPCSTGNGDCNASAFGPHREVTLSWNSVTHAIEQVTLAPGYTGTMQTVMYPDHNGEMHAYSLGVGDVVRRDGQPFEIQWNDSAQRAAQLNDIFNAAMASFAQSGGVAFDASSCTSDSTCTTPGSICECQHASGGACAAGASGQCGTKSCVSDGTCQVSNDGSTTVFGIRALQIEFRGPAGVPQPALSTPQTVIAKATRWEPFSNLPTVLKLDAEGPVTSGNPAGDPTKLVVCRQIVGQTFADFQSNCVQVHGDGANPTGVDAVDLTKVTHGLTHDLEQWTPDVLSVRPSFSAQHVLSNPDVVFLDGDAPDPADFAQEFTLGPGDRGHLVNEYNPGGDIYHPGRRPMLQGSALVMIEWARLLLADIARIQGNQRRTLGDPLCTGFDSATGNPNYVLHPGACSGIEGLIIPFTGAGDGLGGYDFTKDPGTSPPGLLDPGINYDQVGAYSSILAPGSLHGALCVDPGYEGDCTTDPNVSLFENALHHVTRVMGGGDIHNLPSELRDRRYYFKWFAVAYVKYLKAYGRYAAQYGVNVNQYPTGSIGGGLGPSDVMNQPIDLESLSFDSTATAAAGAQAGLDQFEYVDRDYIGQGSGGGYNWIPWTFQYGVDHSGSRGYARWSRRMDRTEIALRSAMLVDKTRTPGQEDDVNLTNLFGSVLLGGDAAAGLAAVWPNYECAIGQAGDPNVNCNGLNPPLDPTNPSGAASCGGCVFGQVCGGGLSYESGYVQRCGRACDYFSYPRTGCQSPSQTCAAGACLDMMMDKSGPNAANPHPLLWRYAGAWARTPFGRGHSPITLAAADKHPKLGVARISIPNFTTGPYTLSPLVAGAMGVCELGYTLSANGIWCNAPVNAGTGTDAPSFTPLAPWAEVQPQVGFAIAIDGQRSQWVSSGRVDLLGGIAPYAIHYRPHTDTQKPSCAADATCNMGYGCDLASGACVTNDDTLDVLGIRAAGFSGQVFLCSDPSTSDILHVGVYDSAQVILDWLAAHPGTVAGGGNIPSAQSACGIVMTHSTVDNSIQSIVSRQYGVSLELAGGGRITGAVVWDPSLAQSH